MSLSPALARRIDRLSRRAHDFHRFAHHPLCERYAGELIALHGRSRMCRGCCYALLGACIGTLAACIVAPAPGPLAVGSALAAALAWRSLSSSLSVKRTSKLWTRGLPALLCSAAVVSCTRAGGVLAWSSGAALVLSIGLCARRYRRRGPDRSACARCPEYGATSVCSGYREIVRAERAFVRRSQQLIDAHHANAALRS
jgi:hypothetical protein